MRRWAVLGVVLLCCESRPLTAGMPTPFQLAEQGGVLIAVMLNGAGPFTMAIDTGANHSAIAEDVAVRIGAPAIARAMVTSSAGSRMRTLVRVQRLAFGPITTGTDATMISRKDLTALGAFDGVIGQDVLAALRYTIDFGKRQIVWHDDEALTAGARAVLDMTFDYGRYLVALPQRGGVLHLVPDSGAGGLVLFQGAGRVLPDLVGPRGGIRLDTFEGRIDAESVFVRELRIGRSTLRNLPAVLVERGANPAADGDGLLPLHFFGRVTFDGPARRLIVG
jgi:predicted aspartyl protease